MQDNLSQLFLRVFSLSRSPQRLLYAEFFFEPRRRRRGKHALIYVRISIYVRCAPTAPRGSQAWTPQPPFVILMSHYIFVWAWAGETRSVKHVVTPVLLEFHPPAGLTHVTVGFVPIERISVDFGDIYPLSAFRFFPPLSIFSIKRRIYHCSYSFSEFYSFTIYFSNLKYFAGKCFVPMDVLGCVINSSLFIFSVFQINILISAFRIY